MREQELNQLKSQFVSTASDEFRTPLTTIQTSVELIELYLNIPTGQASIRQHIGVICNDYLTKPFSTKDLLAAIESRLKRHQQKPTLQLPPVWLQTIQAHQEGGSMLLKVADCLHFYVHNRAYLVYHPPGTFHIDSTLTELAAQLDSKQFFSADRQVIIQRKSIQKYAYWQQGKYCLYLTNVAEHKEIIISKAGLGNQKNG